MGSHMEIARRTYTLRHTHALLLLIICITAILGLLNSQIATAKPVNDSASVCKTELQRPCIGLVLGGGGARGGAHIGVLKVLQEQQIPVDIVVGTSIGSFVGGLYATGKSAAEIEMLLVNADWNSGYHDKISRSDIPVRRKKQIDGFPIQLDLGLSSDGLKLPKGFIQGQAMKSLIDDMLGVYPEFDSFDTLPTPFRAVAANAETGEEVVISNGDLATAMQASMSIPGIVRPTELQDRVLVDGGIANNLPVSVAKALGADIVIAVDIGSQTMKKDKLTSGFAILRQLTGFLTTRNADSQKALLNDTDILIKPDIDDVGMLDFDKIEVAITAGYKAAQKLLAKSDLSRLGVPPQKKTAYIPLSDLIQIDHIKVENDSRLGDDYIKHRLGIESGAVQSLDAIHTGINRLYGQGTFSRVRTSLTQESAENTLHVNTEEKSWGPGYVDFRLSFEDDFDSFSHYQLGMSYRLTNLSRYGAEWFTSGSFGTEKELYTDLYWPIKSSGLFWLVSTEYTSEVSDFRTDSISYGNVSQTLWESHAGIGWHPMDKLQLRASAIHIKGNIEVPWILSPLIDYNEISATRTGGAINIDYDSLDNASFPTQGWKLVTEFHRTKDDLLNATGYSNQVDSEFNGVITTGRHSLRTLLRYQSTVSDNDLSMLGSFDLGGFLNLSGTERDSIVGQHVRFGSLVYTYKMVENDFGAIDLPLYLGMSLETGNAWENQDKIDYGDLILGGSLFIGWDSPIGPAYLAYGETDNKQRSVYVFMGVVF